jgi:hypothetical protein
VKGCGHFELVKGVGFVLIDCSVLAVLCGVFLRGREVLFLRLFCGGSILVGGLSVNFFVFEGKGLDLGFRTVNLMKRKAV